MKMKRITILLSVICLMVSACHKSYEIFTIPQYDQCIAPTDVKATVKYMNVTFDWRQYGDAEYYHLEIYSAVPAAGEEPDPAFMLAEYDLTPAMLPFTYHGPEDVNCYYRVKATRESRKDSRWVTGTFKTDVDPTTTCSTPTNAKALAICDMVVFSWDVYPNTTVYELEVYNTSIPSEGDPDPADLVLKKDLDPFSVPDTVMFDPDARYYYRVRAAAPATELKASKWIRGSFVTTSFTWPTDEKALNTTTTQVYTGTDDDGNPSPFTGTGKTTVEGTVITINGFTYGHKCMYYGNRITLPTGNVSDLNSEFGANIPTKDYMSFKICKPGKLETYFSAANKNGEEACVVLLTNREVEGKVARVKYKNNEIHPSLWASGAVLDKIEIKKGDLYGITEAATVYVFSSNRKGMHVYQMKWTPSND